MESSCSRWPAPASTCRPSNSGLTQNAPAEVDIDGLPSSPYLGSVADKSSSLQDWNGNKRRRASGQWKRGAQFTPSTAEQAPRETASFPAGSQQGFRVAGPSSVIALAWPAVDVSNQSNRFFLDAFHPRSPKPALAAFLYFPVPSRNIPPHTEARRSPGCTQLAIFSLRHVRGSMSRREPYRGNEPDGQDSQPLDSVIHRFVAVLPPQAWPPLSHTTPFPSPFRGYMGTNGQRIRYNTPVVLNLESWRYGDATVSLSRLLGACLLQRRLCICSSACGGPLLLSAASLRVADSSTLQDKVSSRRSPHTAAVPIILALALMPLSPALAASTSVRLRIREGYHSLAPIRRHFPSYLSLVYPEKPYPASRPGTT